MSQYRNHYSRAGLIFRMIQRKENVAMFEGTSKSGWKQYELHVLRLRKTHLSSKQKGEMVLSRASSSEWGKYGFTYQTLDKAQEKMDELIRKQEAKQVKLSAKQSKQNTAMLSEGEGSKVVPARSAEPTPKPARNGNAERIFPLPLNEKSA